MCHRINTHMAHNQSFWLKSNCAAVKIPGKIPDRSFELIKMFTCLTRLSFYVTVHQQWLTLQAAKCELFNLPLRQPYGGAFGGTLIKVLRSEKCLPAPLDVSQVMAPVWQCAGCALVSGLQNVQTCCYFDVKVEQLAIEASPACVCDPAVMYSIKSMWDTLYYNVKNQWAALDNRGNEELPKRMTERDSRQPVWR